MLRYNVLILAIFLLLTSVLMSREPEICFMQHPNYNKFNHDSLDTIYRILWEEEEIFNQKFNDDSERLKYISKGWQKFNDELIMVVNNSELRFPEKTQVFMNVYCSTNGQIDYVFYNSKTSKINWWEFEQHITKFLTDYKFDFKTNRTYSLTGTITLSRFKK